MADSFSDNLRRLRLEKGLTQQQLSKMMFIDRSSVARWENGTRTPDLLLVDRLAECLDVDPSALLKGVDKKNRVPVIILVDDEKAILSGNLRVLNETLPDVEIIGFTKPSEALEFACANAIDLAYLDIELGKTSGIDLCEQLIRVQPDMNIVFLTAYPEYALKAWNTQACGFLVKPLIPDDIRKSLSSLRHPVNGLFTEGTT